jgi:hypothetical protein
LGDGLAGKVKLCLQLGTRKDKQFMTPNIHRTTL